MSERSIPPSAKRLAEARRRGEVAVSRPLLATAALGAAVIALAAGAGPAWRRMVDLAARCFAGGGEPAALLREAGGAAAWLAGPPLAAAAAAALACGLAQTGGLFTVSALAPSLPARRGRDGALHALAIAAATGAAVVLAIRAEAPLALRATARADGLFPEALAALVRIALRVALAGVAIGLCDYLVRRAQLRRSLWMTRAEAQRERREDEGDPRTRGERRRRQRDAGADLPERLRAAHLVLIGGGAAIALRRDEAIRIVASGERLAGARIAELARRLGLPVRSDEDLAPRLLDLPPGAPLAPPLAARCTPYLDAAG